MPAVKVLLCQFKEGFSQTGGGAYQEPVKFFRGFAHTRSGKKRVPLWYILTKYLKVPPRNLKVLPKKL